MLALLGAQPAAGQAVATGPDFVQETYRDWLVRCETVQSADGSATVRLCEMVQELTQHETNQRVLTMAFQVAADDAAAVTLVPPFGLRLSDGIKIGVADSRIMQSGFRTCLPQGCIADGLPDVAARPNCPPVSRPASA